MVMSTDSALPIPELPDWANYVQWWQVYPLGALGADTTGQDPNSYGKLSDLIPWLDHARDLGLNGLSLGPIFKSELHGYDTIDYFQIDPRIGTLDDFQALLAAAHERGLKVMLDGVFNHVSKNYPWEPEQAPAHLAIDDAGNVRVFEGHGQLQELDLQKPATKALIGKVLSYWTDLGVDAWRFDAAYALDGPAISEVLSSFRSQYPQVLLAAEIIHGDYPQLVAQAGFHTCTQYELWKAIWSALKDENLYELAWACGRHNYFTRAFLPWTFIGNHDVTRIASQLPLASRHLAPLLLSTLPGMPTVYYGDELAWEGLKEERFGGDDAIRQALPKQVPGPSERPLEYSHYARLLGLRRRFPQITSGQVQILAVAGAALAYAVRDQAGKPVMVVALNAGQKHSTLPLGEGISGLTASDPEGSVNGEPAPSSSRAQYLAGQDAGWEADRFELDPGAWMIWEV
ncbi:hypothetical protein BSR29_03895 [Boudabousia liubingyangii]|uniref:Glycosyl hydrolase family 13 catalytic domain-containing protein n=2 Tax=Boudabousia liubingyangii TaxID=1921764 RepID=A0A1Q5PN89_9ACTO|nr:hypothetical protein BSR29_03895 [Boudabousia liubingyangii]